VPEHARGVKDDPFWQLLRAFVDEDDAPRFPAEDVRHFLPWCIVHLPIDIELLEDEPREIFAAACEAAEVPLGATRDDIRACLDAWYAAHRPNPALAAAVQEAWRHVRAEPTAPATLAAFAGDVPTPTVLGGGGPRPAGTVPGGPLARLLTTPPKV
jgi:hypothetical protein